MRDRKLTFTCCLCGKEFKGIVYNPYPFGDATPENPRPVCCAVCNKEKVIPERLKILSKEN